MVVFETTFVLSPLEGLVLLEAEFRNQFLGSFFGSIIS